jgi:hypothetical protein
MLLEAYFVVIDYTLNKLTSVWSVNYSCIVLLFSFLSRLSYTGWQFCYVH